MKVLKKGLVLCLVLLCAAFERGLGNNAFCPDIVPVEVAAHGDEFSSISNIVTVSGSPCTNDTCAVIGAVLLLNNLTRAACNIVAQLEDAAFSTDISSGLNALTSTQASIATSLGDIAESVSSLHNALFTQSVTSLLLPTPIYQLYDDARQGRHTVEAIYSLVVCDDAVNLVHTINNVLVLEYHFALD